MAKHQRQKIRDAIKDLLIDNTNPWPWGDRVYTSRANPLQHNPNPRAGGSHMPYVLIYTRTESSEIVNDAPREYRRTVQVEVAVVAASGPDVDDELDDYAYIVERLVMNSDTLGVDDEGCIIADDVRLVSSVLATAGEGSEEIGAIGITFEADYYEYLPTSETNDELADFITAGIDYDVTGGKGSPASDFVSVYWLGDRFHNIMNVYLPEALQRLL